ncbi:hypothetical protein FRC07_008458 [Ceratobasidium sp. 392]|nr:hypothetical protein FRC07_008458 [Ceratobasidium sp. 392]
MWSSNTGRKGKFVLNFRLEWRNALCPVEAWYQDQLKRSQNTGSTTRFSAIQHRRTRETPFFHEFLVIPLEDNSHYRIERMGVGSSLNAITLSGCATCDTIEWFPAGASYEAKVSDLITEVRFPSNFDILDVLAVCYSVQQQPRARRYSLQYFNCYFFCCAILSVLARRVFDFERMTSLERWNGLLEQVFAKAIALCSSPLTAEAKKYSVLRFCAALDTRDPTPGRAIVEELRDLFETESDASAAQESLADVFWLYNANKQLRMALTDSMRLVAKRIGSQLLGPDSVAAKQERGIMYRTVGVDVWFDGLAFIHKETHKLREICFLLTHGVHKPSLGRASSELEYDFARHRLDILEELVNNFLNITFEKLESSDSRLPTTFTQILAKWYLEGAKHGLRYSTKALLYDNLESLIRAEVHSQGEVVTLVPGDAAHTSCQVDLFAFQDHIRNHIKVYADRVESHQLGSSLQICYDVETAMSYVWRRMPEGFGAMPYWARGGK